MKNHMKSCSQPSVIRGWCRGGTKRLYQIKYQAFHINLTGFEKGQEIVSEATKNIRTVASLQCEQKIIKNFDEKLEEPVRNQFKKSTSVGLAMGMADAILFFAYAACFWLGGWLIDNGYGLLFILN